MNNTQYALHHGQTLSDLETTLGIETHHHPYLPLVILNYSQVNSRPKTHPVIMECRGLVLEKGTWDIVSCGFKRFFRIDEYPEGVENFNWDNFSCREKIDGSLIFLSYYDKLGWFLKTRGTFADGICGDSGKSWKELIWGCIDQKNLHYLNKNLTYVMEYVGPWNKVVKSYMKTDLYLLGVFENETHQEISYDLIPRFADRIGCAIPQNYNFRSREDVVRFCNEHPDATFEGVVLVDNNGMRLKVKNLRYDALAHMKDNGNGFSTKNLLTFVLSENEADLGRLLGNFPEVEENYSKLFIKVQKLKADMMDVWEGAIHDGTKKDFALSILGKTPLVGILFTAKTNGVDPLKVFKESGKYILEALPAD